MSFYYILFQVKSDLKEFAQATSDILGDEDNFAVESACVFLYNIFQSTREWSKAHGESIRKTFGPYPASIAMKAFDIVQRIISCLPSDTPDAIDNTTQTSPQNEFGTDIPFTYNDNLLNGANPVAMVTDNDQSDDEEVKSKDERSGWTLLNELDKSHVKHVTKAKKSHDDQFDQKTHDEPRVKKYGSKWLELHCKQYSLDISWRDIYQQLFDILTDDSSSIEHKVILYC